MVLPSKNKENLSLVEKCAAAILTGVIGLTLVRGVSVLVVNLQANEIVWLHKTPKILTEVRCH